MFQLNMEGSSAVACAIEGRPTLGDAVQNDVMLDPFGATWAEMREAALVAEEAGCSGVWTWDHLAGAVHSRSHVLECWTVLSALAAETTSVTLGPLVLNVVNRRPGVVAQMAATLQEVSGGRLVLGIGAGGGPSSPYRLEQDALGVEVAGDATRRRQLEDAVAAIRHTWTGAGVGFLQPDPAPPIVIAGFGPKVAALAGRVADGFNTQAASPRLEALIETALAAAEAAGRDPSGFEISVFGRSDPEPLEKIGVSRQILTFPAPYDLGAIRALGEGS
jgi:alkanesulfonate monooxygenase SsuD/methylene tetrahydromethanopterin reductase-like flavin-dependent oxidoreductase (luciferase family)